MPVSSRTPATIWSAVSPFTMFRPMAGMGSVISKTPAKRACLTWHKCCGCWGIRTRPWNVPKQAIGVARATGHMPSVVEAVIWLAEITLLRRDPGARERVAAALALATEHGLPTWIGMAKIMQGWVLS